MSTTSNVTFAGRRVARARASQVERVGTEMSAPTTEPVGPTRRPAAIVVLPPPQPTSSTCSPGASASDVEKHGA